ncbi:MAG: [LysW]-lysine hydrolase [Chloroflexi bacterium]|nr:[LysW]-lysine hydrolase [Chloroflexota bacterium]
MTNQLSTNNYQTLIGLVSQYSPSGRECGAAEWLVARMKSLGYDKAFIDEAGNPVGVMGTGTRQTVLLGHIDTVPGEIPVREENGVLFGRGAADAKGPLAAFVDAVARVGAQEDWQFVVVGAVEEERDSDGARFVVNQYKPDFVIVGEPNQWDRVALGYKGSAWAAVTVKCEQAHTASGEETAAEAAVEAWLKIRAYAEAFNAGKSKAFDKLLPALRGMESGLDDFEQWARLKVGVRLPLEVPPETWHQTLSEILKNSQTFRVFVEPVGFPIPAWRCEKNTPLVRAFLSGIRSQGGEPKFVYKTGTADLNIVAPVWKCPALVYGPGDSALDHTPNERIDLNDYEKAVHVLSAALLKVAGRV